MSRFSERAGFTSARTAIQHASIDAPLRNALWSAYSEAYVSTEMSSSAMAATHTQFYRSLWLEFFRNPIDELPWMPSELTKRLRAWFFSAEWYEVYDFVEFVARHGQSFRHNQFEREVNRVLEREMAAYRLASGYIVEITEPTELAAIDAALSSLAPSLLRGVREHLETAIEMLSDRSAPDYRNSIKESISAVESIAKILTGDRSADLAKALKSIEKVTPLHGALRSGFLALYGYTSDHSGIRHALVDAPTVDFNDAKYMLVTCSAFVSFLIGRGIEAGVEFT